MMRNKENIVRKAIIVSAFPLALTVMTKGLSSHRLMRIMICLGVSDGLYKDRIDLMVRAVRMSKVMKSNLPNELKRIKLGIIK